MPDNDYTERYNTPLDDDAERQFQQWMHLRSSAAGRDMSKDLYDYDMRGYWANLGGTPSTEGGHLPDTYKKPNHPTFSEESIYSGTRPDTGEWDARLQGGQWQDLGNGKYNFIPGATNLEEHEPQNLIDYFKQVEPNNNLILPGQ